MNDSRYSKHFFILILFFSANITAKYFEQLSNEDIYKLYFIYEDDFNFFGYDFSFRNITLPL